MPTAQYGQAKSRLLICLASLVASASGTHGCATASDSGVPVPIGAGGEGGDGGATSVGGSLPDPVCGNGIIEAGETCEGEDFDGLTCASLQLGPGELLCNEYCQVVASGCLPPETCDNGLDDDLDGITDCHDDDCVDHPACTSSCFQPQEWQPGSPFGLIDSSVGRPNFFTPSCAAESGGEVVYRVTPAENLVLGISVLGTDHSVAITRECGDGATEIACASNVAHPLVPQNLQVTLLGGATYFVHVDAAASGLEGYFDVLVVTDPPSEQSCDDNQDNDWDGFIDCQDSDCDGDCSGGAGVIGDACQSHGDCGAVAGGPFCIHAVPAPNEFVLFLGFADAHAGFTDGYCSAHCDVGGDDCGAGASCQPLGFSGEGVCLKTCSQPQDCRGGYVCAPGPAGGDVCLPAPEQSCDDRVDNDGNGHVDCRDSACQGSPACQLGDTPLGEACDDHAECGSVSGGDPYCQVTTFFFPNGYCSEFCRAGGADAAECGPEGVCVSAGYIPGFEGLCRQRCEDDSDCQQGIDCLNVGGVKVCI